jgi:deoxyhypusine synthase
LRFDSCDDFDRYASIMLATKRRGLFTIGAAQQSGVYAELKTTAEALQLRPAHLPQAGELGGLSGSTYTEAVWRGKFVPPEEGGKFAEVLDDATVALPLIVGAVLQRIGYLKPGRRADRQRKGAFPSRAGKTGRQESIVVAEKDGSCQHSGPQSALVPDG